MVESRKLTDSLSFYDIADIWAESRGLIGAGGGVVDLPEIIGMPNGSTDLGAFNIGIIAVNRNIKQALQDLEGGVVSRLLISNNLSDLSNKATARTNLELGTAATWNVGNAGAVVPLLNGLNTWTGKQTFNGSISSLTSMDLVGSAGAESNLSMFVGANRRWAIIKGATAETGSNNGSDFVIARFTDAGAFIEHSLTITRSTGVMTLAKPLPVGSGGTGVNTLGDFKTALDINNVNNTSDLAKPVSTATQTELSAKLDKVGGTITNSLSVGGYLRTSGSLLATGNYSDGAKVVLGYQNVTGFTGPVNGTWTVGVNGSGVFSIANIRTNGSTNGTPFSISDTGVVSLQNLTVAADGILGNFVGSGSRYQGIVLRNSFGSASAVATSYVCFQNENGYYTSSIEVDNQTNGSSNFNFSVTSAGSRYSDRRIVAFTVDSSSATFNVPINGRAYPRRSDGANINVIWSGQTTSPTWLIGSNNGTDFYPHNPSSVSVGKLADIDGGNGGGYLRRTTDAAGNGNLSSQLILAGNTATNDVWSSPIQLREVNAVGASQSASTYAPALNFNWSGRASSAIKLHSDGSFRFQQANTTLTYQSIWSGEHYATGWFRPQGDQGVYWDGRSRGLTVADNGATYGTVNVTGPGVNGWQGYSIGTWATFMANGVECGIYSAQYNNWLMRFDVNRNAIFAQNVTAYSDERLKQNMRPIDNVTQRREGLAKAAIIYEMNGQTHIGFGAQTLEPSNPEVVNTDTDILNTKTVCYSDTIAILAVDNQALSDRIDRVVSENAELKAIISSLLVRLEKAGL